MPFSLSVQAEEDIVSIAEEGIRIFGVLVAKQHVRRQDIATISRIMRDETFHRPQNAYGVQKP